MDFFPIKLFPIRLCLFVRDYVLPLLHQVFKLADSIHPNALWKQLVLYFRFNIFRMVSCVMKETPAVMKTFSPIDIKSGSAGYLDYQKIPQYA